MTPAERIAERLAIPVFVPVTKHFVITYTDPQDGIRREWEDDFTSMEGWTAEQMADDYAYTYLADKGWYIVTEKPVK